MPPHAGLDRRTRGLLVMALVVLAGASFWRLYQPVAPGPYVALRGLSMGSDWDVKVASEGLRGDAVGELSAAIQARLDHIERLMSTWDPESELSRFNRHTAPDGFPVAPETLAVFVAAQNVSRLSAGAFDVTVAPIVEAWGFGPAERRTELPGEAEIAALRERVGWDRITVDREAGVLRKTRGDVVADLSAIAPGFAADQVAELLEARGYDQYLVEVGGGELRARGHRLDGEPWRVAIERPDPRARSIQQVIALRDGAMATSGDYRNYYEAGGERVSHTIDPRDGHPIRHDLASVSVLHESAMYADALATALNVLGPEAGYRMAEYLELAACFIVRKGPEGFEIHATPAFAPLLEAEAEKGEKAEETVATEEAR